MFGGLVMLMSVFWCCVGGHVVLVGWLVGWLVGESSVCDAIDTRYIGTCSH